MVVQEQTIDVGSKVASVGGGTATLFFGLTASETAAIIGAVVAVVGLVVQVLYTLDKRGRAVELHRLEVERLRNGGSPVDGRAEEDS